MRKTIRKPNIEVRVNTQFRAVLEACAAPRDGQDGTWIGPDMMAAYVALHKLGFAHSVESWLDGQLVGGLYGIQIGRMFTARACSPAFRTLPKSPHVSCHPSSANKVSPSSIANKKPPSRLPSAVAPSPAPSSPPSSNLSPASNPNPLYLTDL